MSWGGAAPSGHMEVGSNAHASTSLYFASQSKRLLMDRMSPLQLAEWLVERTAQRAHFDTVVRNGIKGRHFMSRMEKGGGAFEALLESIGIVERAWHEKITHAMRDELEAAARAAAEGEEERLARIAAEAEAKRQAELQRMRTRAERKAAAMGRADDEWLVDKLYQDELAELEKREAKNRREREEAEHAAAMAKNAHTLVEHFTQNPAVDLTTEEPSCTLY